MSARWATRAGPSLIPVPAFAILAALLIGLPASAHQKSAHAPAAVTVPADSGAARADTLASPAAGAPGAPADSAEPFRLPALAASLQEHVHNRLVHFPIALSIGALVLLLAARSNAGFVAAARTLIVVAALAAIGAYFTGRVQEEAFEGEPKEWLVHAHERWGTASAIGVTLWAALGLWKGSRRNLLVGGVVVVAVVLVTAYFGGVVSHGH